MIRLHTIAARWMSSAVPALKRGKRVKVESENASPFQSSYPELSLMIKSLDKMGWTAKRFEPFVNESIIKCIKGGYLDTARYILTECERRSNRRIVTPATYKELIQAFAKEGEGIAAVRLMKRAVAKRIFILKRPDQIERFKAFVNKELPELKPEGKKATKQP